MIVNSSSTPSSSWDQEKAFAEDMNGTNGNSVGGCVWPPRSYSCAFCLREFRSAQALGGHMNIHRRDRARLNQNILFPQNPNINAFNHHYNPNSIKPTSVSTQENNNNNYYYSCPSSHDRITPPTPSYFPSSLPYYCYRSSRVSSHDQEDRLCLSTGVSMDSETKTNNYWPKRPELLFLLKPLQSPANNIIHEVKAPVASMDDHHLHLDLELRLGHANVL